MAQQAGTLVMHPGIVNPGTMQERALRFLHAQSGTDPAIPWYLVRSLREDGAWVFRVLDNQHERGEHEEVVARRCQYDPNDPENANYDSMEHAHHYR